MDKEALFIEKVAKGITEKGEIDKDFIVEYLVEHYRLDSYGLEGFDKISEIGTMLSLIEKIEEVNDYEETAKETVRGLIYCVALIEGRKHNIDIFKVKDDFGIDELIKKYLKEA